MTAQRYQAIFDWFRARPAALRALGTQLPLERNAVWSLTVTPRFQQWKFALHLEGIILLRPVQSILANRKITGGGEEYVVSTSH